MKLESAQINDLAAAGTRIPNQGQGGRWQGVERPKKKTPQIPKHCRENDSRSIWR